MKEKKWPTLLQDPKWVLEQIEMGFRQLDPAPSQEPMAVPKLSSAEIESAVTRALQEELARLDEVESAAESETKRRRPAGRRASDPVKP